MSSDDKKVLRNDNEVEAGTRDVQPPPSYTYPAQYDLSFRQQMQLFSTTPGMVPSQIPYDRVTTLPFIAQQQHEKSMTVAFLLCIPLLGLFGAHHFYLNRPLLGAFYACSLGMFGVGWIVDWFRIPSMVRECNAEIQEAKERGWLYDFKKYGLLRKRSLIDAYLLWLPYMGLYGQYHFYLGRYSTGLLQALSLGLSVPLWLVDFFRMPYLVYKANQDIENLKNRTPVESVHCNLLDAYLQAFPMGLFGFHHFYLGNYKRGFLYLCTLGVFGLGWLVDLFIMPILVKEANKEKELREQQLVVHQVPATNMQYNLPYGSSGMVEPPPAYMQLRERL